MECQFQVAKSCHLKRAVASDTLQPMVGNQKDGITKRLNEALTAAGYPTNARGAAQRIATWFDVSRETARKWIEGESFPELVRIAAIASEARAKSGDPKFTTSYIVDGIAGEPGTTSARISTPDRLSPEARKLVDLISSADAAQSVSPTSWKLMSGIVNELMAGQAPPKGPIPAFRRKQK